MNRAWMMIVLSIACLLALDCHAEDASRFQSVGGDYGRSVIGAMASNGTQQPEAANNSSNLWGWGAIPKGRMLSNGSLVSDPTINGDSMDLSNKAVSVLGVDTFTGNTIYYYEVPNTGITRYFYIDRYTGGAVYVDKENFIIEGAETTGSVSSSGQGYTLPPGFR